MNHLCSFKVIIIQIIVTLIYPALVELGLNRSVLGEASTLVAFLFLWLLVLVLFLPFIFLHAFIVIPSRCQRSQFLFPAFLALFSSSSIGFDPLFPFARICCTNKCKLFDGFSTQVQ